MLTSALLLLLLLLLFRNIYANITCSCELSDLLECSVFIFFI